MSIIRRALAIPHEERAAGLTWLPGTGTKVPDMPEGYGIPGYGSWGEGMVWQSSVGTSAPVTFDSASHLSAVFGCWRLLTDVIATMPWDTYTVDGGTRLPAPKPTALKFEHPGLSQIAYLSQIMLSLLSDGNAFVATLRDDMGVPLALFPLDPLKVDVQRDKGVLFYVVGGERYGWRDIMHIPGLMPPGALRGMSPLSAAREVIEGGLQQQRYGRDFTKNMAVPPAVIKVPSQGGAPDVEREKGRRVGALWNETYGGGNAGKIGVLVGGAELQTVAVNQRDAQWLESRQFTVVEVARIYGVPPHLVADATNSTSWGSGLAEQNATFSQFTVQPATARIEEAHDRLVASAGLPDMRNKLNIDAKLRATPLQRAETTAIRIANRSMTINEDRALEDRAPVPWGDDFTFLDGDLGAVDEAGNPVDRQATVPELFDLLRSVYLAVGKVVTAEEARELLNRVGADLTGPAPEWIPTGGQQQNDDGGEGA